MYASAKTLLLASDQSIVQTSRHEKEGFIDLYAQTMWRVDWLQEWLASVLESPSPHFSSLQLLSASLSVMVPFFQETATWHPEHHISVTLPPKQKGTFPQHYIFPQENIWEEFRMAHVGSCVYLLTNHLNSQSPAWISCSLMSSEGKGLFLW